MIVLPIVGRELRVAARRPGTYWSRVLTAALLLAVCVWMLLTLGPRWQQASHGAGLFQRMSWVALFFALLAGPLATADCLSSEKREGTLGLLFLTDLKGYDVVLGKLAATSLSSIYGLLAVLPVLAIPILMGGVTTGMFWRVVVVLLNSLFFSLVTGLLVSSLSRDANRAQRTAGLLTLGIPVLIWLVVAISRNVTGVAEWVGWISLASPFSVLSLASSAGSTSHLLAFWGSMAALHILSWLLLALASYFTPRVWQDKAASRRGSRWREIYRNWVLGPPHSRAGLRHRLLVVNPILWLSSRRRFERCYPWIFLMGILSIWCIGSGTDRQMMFTSGAVGLSFITNLVLKNWVANVAARALAADHGREALELLLSTPMTTDELIRGHWLALRRLFGLPVLMAALVQCFGVTTGFALSTPDPLPAELVVVMLFFAMILLLDCWALAWLGMWMGVARKSAQRASNAAVLRVLIWPWVVILLLAVLTRPVGIGGAALWFFISLLVDLGYGAWAINKLQAELRKVAVEQFGAVTTAPSWWQRLSA